MTTQEINKFVASAIKSRKEKALGFFVSRLLAEKGGNIEKIMLFGSIAWGKPDRESDIDLLIFARAPEKLEEKVDELSFEVMMKFGESIEPIIYPASELSNPHSYLPWLVVNKGQEVYSAQ